MTTTTILSKNPNDVQHGGDHYQTELQHWDMCATMGYGWEYYIACATKYTSRMHKTTKDGEGGVLGVQKAMHYVEKLVALINDGSVPGTFRTTQGQRLNLDAQPGLYGRCVDVQDLCKRFCDYNRIESKHQRASVTTLFCARNVPDLLVALGHLQKLHDEVTGYVEPAAVEVPPAEHLAMRQQVALGALDPAEATPAYVDQAKDITS